MITDERDTRHLSVGGVVSEHELRSGPPSAEWLAFLGCVLIRIVAAERALADEQRADPADKVVHRRVGPEVLGQPGHVAIRTSHEAVQRHSGREQYLCHNYLRREQW